MGWIRKFLFPEPLRPYILGGVAIILGLGLVFLFEAVDTNTTSMSPTIPEGARLLVQKRFFTIRRHDIVTLTDPQNPGKGLVKRVIGLPGEEVRMWNGQIYIDDTPITEPYLDDERRGTHHFPVRPFAKPGVFVPGDHYFVLGDNRKVTRDSRTFGPVPRSLIDGKVQLTYWPRFKIF